VSFSIPNPYYAAAKKMIEARVKYEVAKMKASSGCGQPSCNHAPVLKQFVPAQDHPTMPGFYKILNDTPGETGIVYVNGEFHSVHPPGSNRQNELALAGGPEIKPGEAAVYSSEADEVHFSSGCPCCGVTRGLDGNLYDAKGVITTNITSGCTPCPANCSGSLAASAKLTKKTQGAKPLGVTNKNSIPMI
jgi:hypothetical protein